MFLYSNTFKLFDVFFIQRLAAKTLMTVKVPKHTVITNQVGGNNGCIITLQVGSNFCILNGEYRKSQSVSGPFHKLWTILEKSVKVCTCRVGMGETCNHAVAMFRVKTTVRSCLTNPSCTSSANE